MKFSSCSSGIQHYPVSAKAMDRMYQKKTVDGVVVSTSYESYEKEFARVQNKYAIPSKPNSGKPSVAPRWVLTPHGAIHGRKLIEGKLSQFIIVAISPHTMAQVGVVGRSHIW